MNSYLMVYDREHGQLLELKEFSSQAAAMRRRFVLERQHAEDDQIEIVVLMAESESLLRKTHARYFTSLGDLLSNMSARLA